MNFARYIFSALILLLPCKLYADTDQYVRNEIAAKIATSLKNRDFLALEALENSYLNPSLKSPSGKILLSIFEDSLGCYLSIRPIDRTLDILVAPAPCIDETSGPPVSLYKVVNRKWDEVGKLVSEWEKLFPNSPNPKIAKAIYFINRGFYFRGTDWSSNVHPESWPILEKNLSSAKEILVASAEISRKNPIWFSSMLTILGSQSAERSEIDTLVNDALENSQGYLPALQSAFYFMSPRWGGSYKQMDEFAQLAHKKTYSSMGGETYARLYWNLLATTPDEINFSFFHRTAANWPLIKESFEMIIRNHPSERNYSGYALFACLAGLPNLAKNNLTQAGTLRYTGIWPENLRRSCYP